MNDIQAALDCSPGELEKVFGKLSQLFIISRRNEAISRLDYVKIIHSFVDPCGCGEFCTYKMSTAAYCPTSTYPKCNSSMLVRENCMMTCPYSRAVVAVGSLSNIQR